MRVPEIVLADSIKNSNVQCEINGRWYVAKPYGYRGRFLILRLSIAWKVFIGKYDALMYQEDKYKPKDNK